MSASLFSMLNENQTFDTKLGIRKKRCKDEEDRKPLVQLGKAKKKVSFEMKPLVYGEKSCHHEEKKQAELKVKILMTKEEAARLLSKCKDGGRLEFKDVARELVEIPINRVNLVSSRDHSLILN